MAKTDTYALDRTLTFSDGVFAIAITLLAIELKIPALEGGDDRALLHALGEMLPRFIGFFVSFYLIGQSWIEHHRIGRMIKRGDQGMLWRNLLVLLWVSLLPFVTALVSEFPDSSIALVTYATVFALLGLSKAYLWRYAVRRGLVDTSAATRIIALRLWAQPVTATGVAMLGLTGVTYAFFGFAMLPLFNARITELSGSTTTDH